MTDNLMAVLDTYTVLTKDTDLFYLDMPLNTSGLWFADRQTDNIRTDHKDYDVYYRGKDKAKCVKNIEYLKKSIDDMTECSINNQIFNLKVLYQWDFLEKDSEGYYVFANTFRII